MRAAFHFDAEAFGGYYGPPIDEIVVRALLALNSERLHVRVRRGDLIPRDDAGRPYASSSVINELLQPEFPVWFTLDPTSFASAIETKRIYVLDVEGLSPVETRAMDQTLRLGPDYFGALQVQPANRLHWALYDRKLHLAYRIYRRELRLLHTVDVEEENRDTGLMEHWQSTGLFTSVTWESSGVQGTIFDDYDTYDHARRRAEVEQYVSWQFARLTDELLLVADDLDPRLAEALHSAFRAFENVDSPEDLAHVAVSCRRFIERLADALYPPREAEPGERRLDAAAYRNRLWAYAAERLAGPAKELVLGQLEDLGARIDHLDRLANRGVHASTHASEVHRLLVALVVATHDLMSLEAPRLERSMAPYEEAVQRTVGEILGRAEDRKEK